MNVVLKAKELFKGQKPEHFTDHLHCEECEEHDQTLLGADIETIGLEELGNPGWDPLCFSSVEGIKYYIPALVRLSVETVSKEFYFGQFLFHLERDGFKNDLWSSCTTEQRRFIADFLAHMIHAHASEIEANACASNTFRCFEIWSES